MAGTARPTQDAAHRYVHEVPRPRVSIRDRLFPTFIRGLRMLAEKIERVTDDERFPRWVKTEYRPGATTLNFRSRWIDS